MADNFVSDLIPGWIKTICNITVLHSGAVKVQILKVV